jgi:hypothetical protein
MTALHEQRRELVYENAALIQQWLALLPEDRQLDLLRSLVDGYTLPNLRKMNTHVKGRVAKAQEATR